MTRLARLATVLAACWLPLVSGAEGLLDRLAGPDPVARVQQIDEALHTRFDEALQEYAEYIGRNPHDIVERINRCRFMDEFASTYEYASFIDTIYELGDECREELESEYSFHAEVQLYGIEQTYGEERLELAEQTLARSAAQDWSSGQLSRLYVTLANATEATDAERSLSLALKAIEYDEAADVRILVASGLLAQNRRDEVISTLISPVDGHDEDDRWYVANKIRLLAEVGAKEHVIALYQTLRAEDSGYDRIMVSRALRQVGAIEEARESFARLSEGVQGPGAAAERFRFEMSHGSGADALAAYDKWRDAGWLEDPLGINRIALMVRDPLLPWKARDLLGLAGLLLAIMAVAAVVALPVAGIHYRGLARRAASAEPYPEGGWRLRQAWFALFAFNLASVLALYCVGPLDLVADDGGIWGLDASGAQIARMALINTLLVIALLLPLAFAAKRIWPSWQSSTWSAWRSVGMGAAAGVIFRLPLLLAWLASSGNLENARGQDPLWQMIAAVRDEFGVVTALWLLVVFAPVIEEFLFRGVLLNAFASHVKFGWANFIQAALFSAIHMDLRASVSLFLLGFVAGSLTRKSGGLLAAMVLHATFNLGAALLFLSSS